MKNNYSGNSPDISIQPFRSLNNLMTNWKYFFLMFTGAILLFSLTSFAQVKPEATTIKSSYELIPRRGILGNTVKQGYLPVAVKMNKSNSSTYAVKTIDVHQGTANAIQNAIDAASDGDIINIYPGTYDLDEANGRDPNKGGAGGYDYNIFVNKSVTIQGVNDAGTPIANYSNAVAHIIPKRLLSHGNNCAIFVQADNVTISGLEIDAKNGNPGHNFKTVEVVGDNFTLAKCKLNGSNETACLYMDDPHFNSTTNTSTIQSYRIDGNYFNGGGVDVAGIRFSSGAGWSGSVANRVITGNTFKDNCDAIMFVGPNADPWDYYPVGAATITGNTFNNSDRRHVIAWGKYNNAQGYGDLDWQSIIDNNTFDKAVVVWTPGNQVRSWETGNFYNIRGIYSQINRYPMNGGVAQAGDIIKVSAGTYPENVTVDRPLTINGIGSPTVTKFTLQANPVTITGFSASTLIEAGSGSSVQDAINSATAGGTVNIAGGTYTGSLTIDKNVTINSTGATFASITLTGSAVLGSSTSGISAPIVNVNQTGGVGALLNDAMKLVSSGGTINISGTTAPYAAFTVGKSVTIHAADGVRINHGSPGITVDASNVTITGITFDYTTSEFAISVNNTRTNVVVHNCNFFTTNAIENLNTNPANTVDATNNCWGTVNVELLKAKINDPAKVLYDPWVGKGVTVTPVNGLTGVTINLNQVTWTNWDAAGNYNFMLYKGGPRLGASAGTQVGYKINHPANNVPIYSATDVNAITPTPLENNTVYYWYVKHSNMDDWMEFHFTTVPSIDIQLANPADLAPVYTTSVLFTWYTSQSNAGVSFEVQYWQHDNTPSEGEWANNALKTALTTNTFITVNSLLAGKPYYWRVVAKRTSTKEVICYSSVFSFNTTGGATVIPIPSQPAGGNPVYTNTPTLYWYLGEAGTGLTYEVRYASDNHIDAEGMLDVTANGIVPNSIPTHSGNLYYTLPSLKPGTHYYWQVRSVYTHGGVTDHSKWSSVESFVTNGAGTLITPIPAYPTEGSPVYTTAPTFTWYLPQAASGLKYHIQIGESSTGPFTVDITTSVTDQLFYKVSGLEAGKTYYWRIQSKNSLDEFGYWSETPIAVAKFTVAGGTDASYPVACEPVDNRVVYTTRPTLSWYLEGSSLGISGYKVKYFNDPIAATATSNDWTLFDPSPNNENQGQISRNLNQTTWTFNIDLTYGKTYYWAVAATSGSSTSKYSIGSFTVVGGNGQGDPIQSQPEDGSTAYSSSVMFSWFVNGTTTGISSYQLVYSKSDVFDPDQTVTKSVTVTKQYYNVTGLTPGATYYWKVRSMYPGGVVSAWSPVWSFTVQVGSASIVQPLVGGPNNITLNTKSPTLTWVLPAQTTANLSYEVEVAETPSFQNATPYKTAKTNLQLNGLSNNKSYYWRVRSKGNDGSYSYYSNLGRFNVDNTTTGVERTNEIPSQFILDQNYPNPFNPTTMIRFELPKDALVTLKIYNVLGQEVKTLMSAYKSAGTYNVQWNGEDNSGSKVQSGTYIYRIVAGDYVSAKKMIMLK